MVGTERGAVVVPHQQRPVGPGPHEGRVVGTRLQEQVSEAQRERAVATGPDAQPGVRLDRETGAPRVDDDELGAARLRVRDTAGVSEPGGARVVTPEHDAVGVLEIRHRRVHAEGQGVYVVPVEVADLRAVGRVGAAEGVAQALDPGVGVLNAGAGRRRNAERDALRPTLGREPPELARCLVERLVPADALPFARRVLRRDAAERMQHAVFVIDQLRRRPPLAAERLAGGVRGVGLNRH